MQRAAEMSSVASQLVELGSRLTEVSDEERSAGAEDVATELAEVERLVRTASRRLDRLLGTAG